jgi:hypothetical protein
MAVEHGDPLGKLVSLESLRNYLLFVGMVSVLVFTVMV